MSDTCFVQPHMLDTDCNDDCIQPQDRSFDNTQYTVDLQRNVMKLDGASASEMKI